MGKGLLRKLALGVMMGLLLALTAGCGSNQGAEDPEAAGSGLKGVLEVNGSTTVTPIAQAWAEAFMDENPQVEVIVIGTGSGDGIAALINGTANIAMASRDIKDSEKEDVEAKRGMPVEEFVVGRDALAIAVHPSNQVDALTMKEIKRIFTGEIRNWNEVGGKDAEILVYTRDTSSGTYGFFKDFVLQGEEYAADSRTTASNAALAATIAQEETAIGYVGIAFLDDVKPVAVSLDGGEHILPAFENAAKYPIVRNLNMYTAGAPEELAEAFLDFGLGEQGQELVYQAGYLPVK